MTVNKSNMAGGGILTAVGLLVTAQAVSYGLGNLRSIGPGLFPLVSGIALTLLGLGLVLASLLGGQQDELPVRQIRWHAALSVFGGLLAWAVLTPSFGLVPGTVALVLAASFAAGRPRPSLLLGLIVVLCGAGYLLFVKGLGLTLAAFKY
ncbi:tripartite tricarboxylate transporter TctB family protein [Oricola thermophila]|uniref:Tripartite tricarboxylate transporter TctB family protein n=1 Tax=Oricola thermophila TaxID=2742145 RepID=A0A6N1VDU8_9HYPH|nr:tripartite tricarboxylate transporter TctB family protein [Oricola thermophila]QKV19024.1 tripartite tricarboxylate transporter TctB family protein [Oricola thermophila]